MSNRCTLEDRKTNLHCRMCNKTQALQNKYTTVKLWDTEEERKRLTVSYKYGTHRQNCCCKNKQ